MVLAVHYLILVSHSINLNFLALSFNPFTTFIYCWVCSLSIAFNFYIDKFVISITYCRQYDGKIFFIIEIPYLVCIGFITQICFPTIAPSTLGKFACLKNSSAVFRCDPSVDSGIQMYFNLSHIIFITSRTITRAVDSRSEIFNSYWKIIIWKDKKKLCIFNCA